MTAPASPALLALRAATSAQHARLEASLPIARAHAGRAEYAAHIAALSTWLQALPRELHGEQLAWLEADLEAARRDGFTFDIPAVDIPLPDGAAARLGARYVIEGSMLGAKVLHKRLAERLAPWPARWLQGYGVEAGARWSALLASLARDLADPRDIARACEAARIAFAGLSQVIVSA